MSSTRRRRFGLLVMALALAPALLACADVERTVTEITVVQADHGGVRVVAWESDQYPSHVARSVDDECWAGAAVDGPVPEGCLTAAVLSAETDPFGQAPLIAGAGTAAAIVILLLLAWKQGRLAARRREHHRGRSAPTALR